MRVNGKQIACDQNSNTYQIFSFDLSLIVKTLKTMVCLLRFYKWFTRILPNKRHNICCLEVPNLPVKGDYLCLKSTWLVPKGTNISVPFESGSFSPRIWMYDFLMFHKCGLFTLLKVFIDSRFCPERCFREVRWGSRWPFWLKLGAHVPKSQNSGSLPL